MKLHAATPAQAPAPAPTWVMARPLPTLTSPTPGDWTGQRVADFYYYTSEGKALRVGFSRATAAPLDKAPAVQFAGRSFDDAVVQAGARSRALGGIAQAVLQGSDGSFFLSHLSHDLKPRTRQVSRTYDVVDGREAKLWGEIVPVQKSNDLKAIVGEKTWYDFRNGRVGADAGSGDKPQSAPLPLPATTPASPEGLPRLFGGLNYVGGRFGTPVNISSRPTAGSDEPGQAWAWAGRSLPDAVAQAAERAKRENGIAQGVAQAADGTYWLTRLGHSFNVGVSDIRGFNYIDPDWLAENKFKGVRAQQHSAALQAVVGASTWIPLSPQAAQIR